GAQVAIDVGGVSRTFTLDSNGNSTLPTGETLSVSLSRGANGSISMQAATFTMTIAGQNLKSSFTDEGLTNATVSKGVAILVQIGFGGPTDVEPVGLIYVAHVNDLGKAQ